MPEDKSSDCGRAISELERFTWREVLHALQVRDIFTYKGGTVFSWNNGQLDRTRKLARLDRFYTPTYSKVEMRLFSYFIHGHAVGSDHALVQVELHIGQGEVRKFSYKWNVAHLGGEIGERLRERWDSLPRDASFFFKPRNIT